MNRKSIKKILSLFLIITFVFSAFGIVKATADTATFTLTGATIKEKDATVEADITVSGGNIVNDLTFHKLNDSITYTLTFKNNDSKDYIIKGISDNNSNEYLKYEYDQHADETIKAGETKDIELKVTYIKEVTDTSKRNATDTVKLSFDIEDTEGNKLVSNVTINPKTNDGIAAYIVIAAASAIGLAVLLFKTKKSGKILVMLALILPIAVKAAEASFIITINSKLKLHDKVLVTTEVNGEKVETLIGYDETPTKPADPVVDGQDFLGWFVGDEPYDFTTQLSDDVVVVAKFKPTEYTITFDPNGGKVATESIKFTKGQTISAQVPFPYSGKVFTGWYDTASDEDANLVIAKNGEFTPSGNITVYAHWEDGTEPNVVDVDGDNSVSEGDIVNFGPEEFIVIDDSYYYGTVKLIAKNPLGIINGQIRQSTTDLIKSKYSDTTYWAIPSTPGSNYQYGVLVDTGFYYNVNVAAESYANNYNYDNTIPDLTVHNNSLYDTIHEYYDYLNTMSDFSSSYYDDGYLPDYDDLRQFNCDYSTDNSCDSSIASNYNYWLGTIFFDSNENDALVNAVNGYYNKDKNTVENASIDSELYIRPVIIVYSSDIHFE